MSHTKMKDELDVENSRIHISPETIQAYANVSKQRGFFFGFLFGLTLGVVLMAILK